MIEFKLNLEHEGEVQLLSQFVGILRGLRKDIAARGGVDSPVPPGGELVNTEASAQTASTEPGAADKEGITDLDLENALMSYAKGKGTPAAIELLAEFGVKRLPELASKDRARFYAKCYA